MKPIPFYPSATDAPFSRLRTVQVDKVSMRRGMVHETPGGSVYEAVSDKDLGTTLSRTDALLAVCDYAPLMMGIARFDGDVVRNLHASAALAGFFGVAPADIENKTLEELGLSESLCALWRQQAMRCEQNGHVMFEYDVWEKRESTATTEQRWVKVSLWLHEQPNTAAPGTLLAYLVEDISGYRATEAALRESQRFLEQVAATTPHIWYVFDLVEGRNIYANREIAQVLGYSVDEIQAMGAALLETIVHPDDMPGVRERFAQHPLRKDGEVSSAMFRARLKSGEYRWLDCHEVPFARDAETGLVRQILGVSQDITERREALDALMRSENQLRLAVEGASIGTFVADLVEGVAYLSPHARRHLGVPLTQETLTLTEMSELVYEADRAVFNAAMDAAIRERALFAAEYRVYQPDGSLHWGSVKAQLLWDETTGMPLQMVGVCLDIEERKRAEAKQTAEAERQTRIADTLQRSLLSVAPQGGTFQPSEHGGIITLNTGDTKGNWELAVLYEPAWNEAQIGGDFYDIFAVDEERTAFVIGDVSGKGLGAAESVAEIKFGLRSILRGISADPSFALRFLNDRQIEAQTLDGRSRELLIAVTIVIADNETGSLQIARAGAEPPLICRIGSGEILLRPVSDVADLPIGALPETQFHTLTEMLAPDETLLLYTDGLTDGCYPHREAPSLQDAAWEVLKDVQRTGLTCADLCQRLLLQLTPQAGFGRRRDDICLLAARRTRA